eukprot:75978_1
MECRVGLPTDGLTRWRCDICSLLNIYTNDECSRCKEPMTNQRKQRNILKPRNKTTSNNKTKIIPSVSSSNSSSKSTSRRSSISMRNAGKSILSQQHSSKQSRFNPNKDRKRRTDNKNKKKLGFNNDYKMKKLKKEDLSTKHLGYKSSKKRNVNTFVRSKLNHDTASYRAKFEGKGNPNDKKRIIKGMKKGVQYATINDLTKNGFTTTLSNGKNKNKSSFQSTKTTNSRFKKMSEKKKASIRKLNDDRPVTPPPKGVKSKGGRTSLIDRLQKAHTGEIMANLRAGGRYMRPQQKRIEGGTTVHAL